MSNIGLKEVLKGKPDGEDLIHNLENIEIKAEPLLSKIVETFPDYTKHDISHSEEILKKLDFVIPNSLKEKLNAYEIFFLIASVYLHDVGMVNLSELIEKEELKEILDREKIIDFHVNKDRIIRDHIRENHHIRSEKFIVKNFKDLAIWDEPQAKIIGRICRGHRKENLYTEDFEPDRMYKSYSINVPLLAALLRISDELDLTFERTPLIVYEHAPPIDDISKDEWKKHLSISGVGPQPEDPLTIKCSAQCKDPKIHRALKRLENKISEELEDLPNHLHQYRESRKDLPRQFLLEIEAEGYKPYDLKFSLQEKEILDLLMGEKLYGRKEESLRELLKNSVDACRSRRELLEKRGLGYTPTIVFKLISDSNQTNRIVVDDNGIGMDEDIVERYFAKIGKSFYRSPEFLEKGYNFTPVSELGIGILSCFMIANKITIETKTDNSDSILIEIDDVSDYFIMREGTSRDTGTTVTLFLKENVQQIDLVEEIRLYARHLEFPVKVILPSGKEEAIDNGGFKPDLNAILGWRADFFDFYPIKVDNSNIEGIISFLFEKDEKLGLKPTERRLWEIYEGLRIEKVVSNEGIFVAQANITPEWIESSLIFADLNLKKGALDLNVSRNGIVRNDKFDNFINKLETIIINDLEGYLREIEQKARKAGIDYIKLFGTFFSRYTSALKIETLKDDNKLSDKILDFIKKFYYFKCISKDRISYMGYNKIAESGKPICMLENLGEYANVHIMQIFSGCSGFTEDKLYLLAEYPSSYFAEILFKDLSSVDFTSFFFAEKSDELKSVIPKTWKLMRFRNYKTSKFIELGSSPFTVLNRDNRFIDLLIKNKHILRGDKETALIGFFKSLRVDLRSDFQKIVSRQKDILKWFIDARLIDESEGSKYVLTREDFPPHLLKKGQKVL